jgi:hypothetical protein
MPSILAKPVDIPRVPFYFRNFPILPNLFVFGRIRPLFERFTIPTPIIPKPLDFSNGTFSSGPFSFLFAVFGHGGILPFFGRAATAPSRLVNASSIAAFFSRFPVRIHKDAPLVEEATQYIIKGCTAARSKEWKQAVYRHSNPYGNVYVLCHSECEIERLKLFAKVIELLWINDGSTHAFTLHPSCRSNCSTDVTEELSHIDALGEHDILRQALDPHQDTNPDTGMTIGAKKQYLREVRDQMLALDPYGTPTVLNSIDKFLKEHDRTSKDFSTMAEYLPFRNSNVGYG